MRVVEHPIARFRHTPGDYGLQAEWDLYRDTPAVTPEPRLVANGVRRTNFYQT